jgi:hypothetical protein
MIEFIHNIYQLYSVSDLIGPSSGASFKGARADWYVVIHVLFDTQCPAAGSIEQYVYYHLPIRSYSLKDAPEDGPMRSETL